MCMSQLHPSACLGCAGYGDKQCDLLECGWAFLCVYISLAHGKVDLLDGRGWPTV
jgi:hypothetical protein